VSEETEPDERCGQPISLTAPPPPPVQGRRAYTPPYDPGRRRTPLPFSRPSQQERQAGSRGTDVEGCVNVGSAHGTYQ
jgi:hypothetical protein